MANMQKMRKLSISPDVLAVELKKRIASGIYPSNSFMPSERQLAAEFEVCRNVIVEAISILTDEGLTERTPRRGTRVFRKRIPEERPIHVFVPEKP